MRVDHFENKWPSTSKHEHVHIFPTSAVKLHPTHTSRVLVLCLVPVPLSIRLRLQSDTRTRGSQNVLVISRVRIFCVGGYSGT